MHALGIFTGGILAGGVLSYFFTQRIVNFAVAEYLKAVELEQAIQAKVKAAL